MADLVFALVMALAGGMVGFLIGRELESRAWQRWLEERNDDDGDW